MPRVIGFLRVSTDGQDTEKFKNDILRFSNDKRIGPVEWVEETVSGTVDWKEREIGRILKQLKSGDIIITPEISRFARSLLQILQIIEEAKKQDVAIYALKGNWQLNGNMESKVMLAVLGLVAEVERDLISMRTKEALAARRAAGVKLGRKKRPGKSRLDQYKVEIVALLRNGSPKSFIARRYKVSEPTLYNWISKNQLNVSPIVSMQA
ncbi:MAG: recombinase family protein [Syntrophobacteraceae bacterium]|jgi:DNA invertase Pin-like site-specific DNA recombinase